MRGRLERDNQRTAVQWAYTQGIVGIKLTMLGGRGVAGWPDYLFVLPTGRVLFVEFKRPGEGLTQLQEHKHGVLKQRHQQVETIDDVKEFKRVIAVAMGAAPIPEGCVGVPPL